METRKRQPSKHMKILVTQLMWGLAHRHARVHDSIADRQPSHKWSAACIVHRDVAERCMTGGSEHCHQGKGGGSPEAPTSPPRRATARWMEDNGVRMQR